MPVKYILDTNVFIEAYKGYYHPDIVPVYWDILKRLGNQEIIKSPKQVREEIKIQYTPSSNQDQSAIVDRFLFDWSRAQDNKCFLTKELPGITEYLRSVQEAYLIVKQRHTALIRKNKSTWRWPLKEPVSDNDMFVIATVLFYKSVYPSNRFVLVTKENNDHPPKHFKPAKIPHICEELNIEWMSDFNFIKEVGITFNTSAFLQ